MDPESVAFQPREEFWRFQSEMLRVQQNQAELSDRVCRLERKQDDDSRLKNVWGTSSPFPSVLGGTPQQVPLQQPLAEHFANFDGHSSNLIGSLQLDGEDEPRRLGTTSRANSVRFDETANHGHWAHASRSSLDLIARTGSGMGGHLLSERSYSHKSDGRQSSAGHSVYSANSGRANSLTGLGPTTPVEAPGLAPGLFILGSVPAIIRCWLNTDFKHDTLLYAAVCSGSYTSHMNIQLVKHLGFLDQIHESNDGSRKIRLPVYLPEAVPVTGSSRPNSPAPQLPSVSVEFTVVGGCHEASHSKAIQIFIGSDVLRAHNADILFSANQLTLYDDGGSKLQVPLVRPEDDRTFKPLFTYSQAHTAVDTRSMADKSMSESSKPEMASGHSATISAPESPSTAGKLNDAHTTGSSDEDGSNGRRSLEQRPHLGLSTSIRAEQKGAQDVSPVSATLRPSASPALLSNWRRDTQEKTNTGFLDWANVGKTSSSAPSHQRRDTGIKVLKPMRASTRTVPTSTSPPVSGQSRFFDDGKRRGEGESMTADSATPQLKTAVSGDKPKDSAPTLPKTRTANPVAANLTAFALFAAIALTPPLLDLVPVAVNLPSPASVLELPLLHGRLPSVTTASTKKRKTASSAQSPQPQPQPEERADAQSPNAAASPQTQRIHSSTSPPRYLPPHLHDEVLDAGPSSPSEAYSHLTLESGDAMTADSEHSDPQQQKRPPPRASSPAKRLHSDMDDADMDLDAPAARTNSDQSSPRATKPLSAATSQRSARAMSVEMADAPSAADVPSLDEQVKMVLAMTQADLEDRQEGYVISEKWLARVWARTSENINNPERFSKEATQGPIGPVDNAELVDPDSPSGDVTDQHGDDFIALRKGSQMHQDFEVLPVKAWELVVSWYGLKEGCPIIRRHVQNTVPDKSSENLEWELFPPVLTVRKVRKALSTAPENARLAEKIVASRSDNFLAFLETAKKAASIDLSNKVRVWRIVNSAASDEPQPQQQPVGMLTPDASPRNGSPVHPSSTRPPLAMDVASFNGLTYGSEREIVTGKDEKANADFNESLTLAGAGLTQDQVVVLEEHDDKGEYISDTVKIKNKVGVHKDLQSNPNSGRSTPTGRSLTRGKRRDGKVRGHVGLTNLGNTCYMNSALQCLRSVKELSLYFLSNKWKQEINTDNPIGHKGAIAKSYAGVLGNIYDIGTASSVSPKAFKQALGKANGLFSGYGQQDSQEFLSWLVDALHEDLNRIYVKPYRENPDSDDNTINDPEAMKQLGETYRSNHRARNDSVATDLFSGFYKNTMVCPECNKVSITFDPYSQLTLQLPIEQSWTHTITYVPVQGKAYQLEVDIDKNATIKALKEYVAKRFGTSASRLMASEVYSHKFYRHLDDKTTISESSITTRDDIFFYELDNTPTNWPAPQKKGSKYKAMTSGSSDEDIPSSVSPAHDRIMVPVFNRGPSANSYRGQSFSMALTPFFIVLTREEAKDYDTILQKVLAKVAQMTTRPILTELSGGSSVSSRVGSDAVLTTEEDAAPNGDPRVKDESIEGEDMVEVTMTDSADHSGTPEMLRPGAAIHPEFRQLFEMKHTRKGTEFVTTGWSTVDHSRALESITKRIRVAPSRADSEQSSVGTEGSGSGSSSEEDGETPQSAVDAADAIEAANVSSDEEMQSIETEPTAFSRGGRQGKKKSKKQRKQERKMERKHKNNKNFKKKAKDLDQPAYPEDPDDENDQSLIRLGEALVLEWTPEAFEGLFGATSPDDPRGTDAMKNIDMFEDPELREKKAKRKARKQHGITLDECFMETSKSEVLSEDNAWFCSRCKTLRRATKTLEIWTVPDILIIHLKRFSGHRSFRDKIEELIDFPVEGLDLSGKVGFPENKDLTYDLFAVDNHYGGLGGGHYTATAQNFFDKQWYNYNDSMVSKCGSGEKAVTSSAYLLFYRRRAPDPLGPPSLQQLVNNSNPGSEDDNDSEHDNRSRSPAAGNGLRLGDSSRNGSSSVGAAAAGAGALRGGGSALSIVANRPGSAAGVATLDDEDDTLPPYNDEGYGGDEDDSFSGVGTYAQLNNWDDQPVWSFDGLKNSSLQEDDVASDMVNLGSGGADDLNNRMLEDFGDEYHAGATTPTDEGIHPLLGGEDGDDPVAEIHVPTA
ncbi:cysteine proteinase [Dothidotthia symphoricarpi CBS 119687]|uniref:ubiquitinyl hydrolase 1 n=1 Tax=Dothidotthia symphoricarpi CBS 119687 TaxID=1392245 RepID=A0A6A6A2U9_9PLEO|nr:cysteine proteinase [Dothidotthia symphoricarpi CBS 119687]KAF2126189.1 cysteine proteinase [Dothidotthia symphoricarpi CBS 119687]